MELLEQTLQSRSARRELCSAAVRLAQVFAVLWIVLTLDDTPQRAVSFWSPVLFSSVQHSSKKHCIPLTPAHNTTETAYGVVDHRHRTVTHGVAVLSQKQLMLGDFYGCFNGSLVRAVDEEIPVVGRAFREDSLFVGWRPAGVLRMTN